MNTLENTISTPPQVLGKLFTEKQVALSAFLAGPLSAGILLYLTHKRIGENQQASYAILGTVLFTILLIGLSMSLPDEWSNSGVSQIMSSVTGGVMYMAYHLNLGSKVKAAISNGAETASNWSVAGISIAGLVLTLALIFSLALAMPPYEGAVMEFGPEQSQVYYEEGTASIAEIETIAGELTYWGYFAPDYQNAVHVDNGNTCILTIPVVKNMWEDPSLVEFGNGIRNNLSIKFEKDVLVVFEDYDLGGKRLTKSFK